MNCRGNVEANGLSNRVQTMLMAISDSNRETAFCLRPHDTQATINSDGNASCYTLNVSLRTLDSLELSSKIDIIKIDAESADMGIIEGIHAHVAKSLLMYPRQRMFTREHSQVGLS